MNILMTHEEFASAKHKDEISLECYWCKSKYFQTKNYILRSIKRYGVDNHVHFCSRQCNGKHKKNKITILCIVCNKPRDISPTLYKSDGNFCSNKCATKLRKICQKQKNTKITLQCHLCKKEICKYKSELKSSLVFCSRSCRSTYYNRNKAWSVKRSKMEIFIEQQIRQFYPEVRLICNNREILNGLELDFYFPELKFGIELNGIVHYEPIYGPDRLTEAKNCDERKIIECYKLGIELAIVDISQYPNFTEKSKNFYWDIIDKLLRNIPKQVYTIISVM